MAAANRKKANATRRVMSLIFAISMVVTLFTVGAPMAIGAPTDMTDSLNKSVPVQTINMLPMETGNNFRYPNEASGSGYYENVQSSTTTSGNVTVTTNEDNSVTLTVTGGSAVTVTEKSGQLINLAQNPWTTIEWAGSGEGTFDARIDFKLKKNGSASSQVSLDLADLANGRLSEGADTFDVNTVGHKLSNLYRSLYQYRGSNTVVSNYWPNWVAASNSADDCMVLDQVVYTITPSTSAGVSLTLYGAAIGRETMDRPANLFPIVETDVSASGTNNTGTNTNAYSALVSNVLYLRNKSTSETAVFGWEIGRTFNASELQALFVDLRNRSGNGARVALDLRGVNKTGESGFTGGDMTNYVIPKNPGRSIASAASDTRAWVQGLDETRRRWYGRVWLEDMVGGDTLRTSSKNYENVEIDFYSWAAAHTGAYYSSVDDGGSGDYTGTDAAFFPADSLIYIDRVVVFVAPSTTVELHQLQFNIANDLAPSTEVDTAYPWAADTAPKTLPTNGTPASSVAIEGTDTGIAYNWAATTPPNVQYKTDLLAMWIKSENAARYADGSVQKAAGASDGTAIRFRRDGDTNVNLNFNKCKYLYYSYESVTSAIGIVFTIGGNMYYLHEDGIRVIQTTTAPTSAANRNAIEGFKMTAQKRTGCIDLSRLGFSGTSNSLSEWNVYLCSSVSSSSVGGVKLNYLFIGSESLADADSVTNTVALKAGDAFPWGAPKTNFDTDSDSYAFTKKVDLISEWNR
ncbi:MAG: hypothetical protein IJU16_02425, partial [Clostridia bacterium]|nr:hypothetical protein [Clostridia bacterium]